MQFEKNVIKRNRRIELDYKLVVQGFRKKEIIKSFLKQSPKEGGTFICLILFVLALEVPLCPDKNAVFKPLFISDMQLRFLGKYCFADVNKSE